MIQVFSITLSGTESNRYNVYHFYPAIYFVRSVYERRETAGFLKGISIWKSNGKWISAWGFNEALVSQIGNEIEKYNEACATQRFAETELSIN